MVRVRRSNLAEAIIVRIQIHVTKGVPLLIASHAESEELGSLARDCLLSSVSHPNRQRMAHDSDTGKHQMQSNFDA